MEEKCFCHFNGYQVKDAEARKKIKESISYFTPQMFGAVADGTTDDSEAIQSAIDAALQNGIGRVFLPSGNYAIEKPILLRSGVNLIGENRNTTKITKTTAATVECNLHTSTFVPDVYEDGNLPSQLNAIIILYGDNGRYCGEVRDLDLIGSFDGSNHDTLMVEFGIVSNGTVSDTVITENLIHNCRYGVLIKTIFASEISNNRIFECHHGMGFEDSTSLSFNSNYCCSCRNYAYSFRCLMYSTVMANACDALNRSDFYKDRSIHCIAYRFNACFSCSVISNGQEGTLGTNWYFRHCKNMVVEGNASIRIGSDYTGTDNIAWMYFTNVLQNSRIANNLAYGYNAEGLLIGDADPTKHHNIYFEGMTYVDKNTMENNMVVETLNGIMKEAGWLNNNPTNLMKVVSGGELIKKSETPFIKAETQGDLSVEYLDSNEHYSKIDGEFVHVWGCFHAKVVHTTASGYLMIGGMPNNGGKMAVVRFSVCSNPIENKVPGSFRVNSGYGQGIVVDTNGGEITMADVPSGSTIWLYYDGIYKR